MELKKESPTQAIRKVTLKEAREFAQQLWDDPPTVKKIKGIGFVVDKRYPFLQGDPFRIKDKELVKAFKETVAEGFIFFFFCECVEFFKI